MTLKKRIKNIERTAIFFLKISMFVVFFLIFFGLFSIEHPQLTGQNRTAAITITTFIILGLTMSTVYGGFAVGKKKSKEIISGLSIAVFITDIVTYLQLCIMNVNQYNEDTLTFANIGVLIFVLILQVITVYIFVYFGNFIYFKMNKPENCVLVCDDISNIDDILKKIGRYKKQYKIVQIVHYDDKYLMPLIRDNDSVFVYNVPAVIKNQIVEYAYKHLTNIYLTTELSDIVINYARPIVVDDLSILASNIKGLTFEQRVTKRFIDILFSGLILLIFSPVILVEAILIKIFDNGPVFYKQERLTIYGHKFYVLKFRTMVVDAEKDSGAILSTKNDSRVTPIGKFLRATRMDELPQLINVLKGDMSMVGPRPERAEIATEYYKDIPEFKYRLRAKAGLTGLAQITGKYNTTPKDKLILDLMYIEKYSIWQDILLIFQTMKVFFKSDSTEGVDK